MRNRTKQFLLCAVATFVALTLTIDTLTVAAVYETGFAGILGIFLSVLCIIIGTMSAYVLTIALIRAMAMHRIALMRRRRAARVHATSIRDF